MSYIKLKTYVKGFYTMKEFLSINGYIYIYTSSITVTAGYGFL